MAIVGATGAVGAELIQLLEQREFPLRGLKLLASPKSAGKVLKFKGEEIPVEALSKEFVQVDGHRIVQRRGRRSPGNTRQHAVNAGAVVIDNSSAFRMEPDVPLVVPEINPADIQKHRGIIANPNCTTIIALMAIYPLHKVFRVKRVIASSYQAVSGAGAKAIRELALQSKSFFSGEPVDSRSFSAHRSPSTSCPRWIFFSTTDTPKRKSSSSTKAGRSCIIRLCAHRSPACACRFSALIPLLSTRSLNSRFRWSARAMFWRNFKVWSWWMTRDSKSYPMPLQVAGKNNCQVGRIRPDTALDNGLAFWVCGDQLLKGAALNALQIAEMLAVSSTASRCYSGCTVC